MDLLALGIGLLTEIVLFFSLIMLHVLLPGWRVGGYCCDSNMKPLMYKLNGLPTLLVTPIIFLLVSREFQVMFYEKYYECIAGANVIGLLLSLALFLRGGQERYYRCFTVDQIGKDISKYPLGDKNVSLLQRFYLGCEWNPRFLGIDSKMFLYLFGAVRLELNILSCCAWQYYSTGSLSKGLIVYTLMFLWFLHEYMYFENIHLYTYDLFAEKVGFKLTWGCVVFYPFFYCIGVHSILQVPPAEGDLSMLMCVATAIVFLGGWVCTRGANVQKYLFRTQPDQNKVFFGLCEQRVVPGTRILCSGFWGVARHFNYFGEIIQGVALALPGVMLAPTCRYIILPLLYPLFYMLLFVTRQIDDDALCSKKYGGKWSEYCSKVQWRICPGIW